MQVQQDVRRRYCNHLTSCHQVSGYWKKAGTPKTPSTGARSVHSPTHGIYSPLAVNSPNNVYKLISRTTNCWLYSNISQILLLYKVWGFYYKFDSMKSLGVYYWHVKMPRCGCVEHGLEYITFHVQKHIAHLAACSEPPLVGDAPLGTPTFLKLA